MYMFGLIIVVLGLAFLLRNLGFLAFAASFWSVFYPLVIVLIGLGVVCATYEGRKLLKKIKSIFSSSEDR